MEQSTLEAQRIVGSAAIAAASRCPRRRRAVWDAGRGDFGSPGTGPKTASARRASAYHRPMTLHDDAAYRAITTHDARFDGRFFVGVTTTRIYCRPVCRVRMPRRENCRFFANAALAEADGFRPCLRCRPELAPGLSLMDSSQALAQQAARTIEQAAHDGSELQHAAAGRAAGRHRPPPAPHLPAARGRGADRLPDHAAPAAGQAAAHRHRAAGDAGRAGQRLFAACAASTRRSSSATA